MSIMHDTGGLLPRDAAMNRPASAEEQRAIAAAVEKGLDEGGLGMGMGITYTPTASSEEILNLFYLAAKFKRPVFVHAREGGNAIQTLQEVIANAAASGAPLHIVHINSIAMDKTAEALRMIDGTRARGLDVTMEAYPYTAGMTEIASAMYSNWESRPAEYFARFLWPPTGERLTRESFERYRKQGGFVAEFRNTEDMVRLAISHPGVMIATDGILQHPRSSGTYARVLGKYAREEKALTFMDAIRKSSLLPAQRLEAMSPQMRQKGRFESGCRRRHLRLRPQQRHRQGYLRKSQAVFRRLSLRDGRRNLCRPRGQVAGRRCAWPRNSRSMNAIRSIVLPNS